MLDFKMPQSLAQIYIHLVFSTKERTPMIAAEHESRLFAYLAGTCNAINCPAIKVGGMPDHVHLLFRLARTVSMSDAVKNIKTESSKWMKAEGNAPDFAWQGGYGAFSISPSHVDKVANYIRDHAEHHKTHTFQSEFRRLLEKYGVSYDEAYVWD
jgi:putative transposase